MSKHEEFLSKLAALMEEYNAEFDLTYYESGCDCCIGEYEFKIDTGKGVDRRTTEIHSSYICPFRIKDCAK
jgi:hypothetical protein